ncbi:MAG: flagellar motor switch protein FliN [Terriglobia bacterium]|nr:MAG: flagellar motor switch protein FliN [Terriglobia bacterium]
MSSLSEHSARPILGAWADSLAQVLESMTDQRPAVDWCVLPAQEAIPADEDILWWTQGFHHKTEAEAWVATSRQTWEYAGTLTLKAAGLETSSPEEVKNTWLEILGQWLSALARALTSHAGSEVACQAGAEQAPSERPAEWISVTLCFGETRLSPIAVAFSPELDAIFHTPPSSAEDSTETGYSEALVHSTESAGTPANSRTMDLLLDVELPVSISFGKTQLPLKDVLRLTTGSIVELNRGVGEQVEVLVNHCLVARGEVVVVEGNYGVRIQQIVSRLDRLRSLR